MIRVDNEDKETMTNDFFKSILQGIDIENELAMWSNEKLADLLTTYIWADIDLNSPKSAVLSIAIERLKAARLADADADALAEKAEKASTELELMFEGNFVSWSGAAQDALRELDEALRQYREACDK